MNGNSSKRLQSIGVIHVLLLIILSASSTQGALADESYYPAGGSTASRTTNSDIRMETEVVTIHFQEYPQLGSYGSNNHDDNRDYHLLAYVECTFLFRNYGPDTVIIMAFPENTSQGFEQYRSWIDNLEWPTICSEWEYSIGDWRGTFEDAIVQEKRMIGEYDPVSGGYAIGRRDLSNAIISDEHQGRTRWRLKTVPFSKGQTRIVIDSYILAPGNAGGHQGTQESYEYIMTTGGTWRGTIGYARLSVDVSNLAEHTLIYADPADDIVGRETNLVIWEYRDLEPREEIDISFRCHIDRSEEDRLLIAFKDMHSINPVFQSDLRFLNGQAMVPADAIVAQYCNLPAISEIYQDSLTIHGNWESGGSGACQFKVGDHVVTIDDGFEVRLSIPPIYDTASRRVYVPYPESLKVLGGQPHRLYGNGPLLVEFPKPDAANISLWFRHSIPNAMREDVFPIFSSRTILFDVSRTANDLAHIIISKTADERVSRRANGVVEVLTSKIIPLSDQASRQRRIRKFLTLLSDILIRQGWTQIGPNQYRPPSFSLPGGIY